MGSIVTDSGELEAPSRVLIVVAHPDDIDFGMAGTVALLTSAGSHVEYCLATSGDAGGDDLEHTTEELAALRQAEQTAAAGCVGVSELHWLGHPDGMVGADLGLRRDIARVIRMVRPDVVICQTTIPDWDRIYISHPDHLATATAALAAVYPDSRNPRAFPELLDEGHQPHTVEELWLIRDRTEPLHRHHRHVRRQGGGAARAPQPDREHGRPRRPPARVVHRDRPRRGTRERSPRRSVQGGARRLGGSAVERRRLLRWPARAGTRPTCPLGNSKRWEWGRWHEGSLRTGLTCPIGGSTAQTSRPRWALVAVGGIVRWPAMTRTPPRWVSKQLGTPCAAPIWRPTRCCSRRRTRPYFDKTNATAIHAALDLPQSVWAVDMGGAPRSSEAVWSLARAARRCEPRDRGGPAHRTPHERR